jgi:hypothetical protein
MVYNSASLRYYLRGLQWLLLKGKLLANDNFKTVQRYYTDGYYHRHFTPRELTKYLNACGLNIRRLSVSHMKKRMIPAIPQQLDEALKEKFGWFVIAEFDKR